MKKSPIKAILLSGVAVLVISGTIGWNFYPSNSYAAEDHGDDHGEEDDGHGHGGEGGHAEGAINLSAEQIAAANIKVSVAAPGKLSREVSVPGKIIAAADRMAQIVPKVGGIVTEARKNLGDSVAKGEVMALIESREMAEAVADYLAAKRAEELARITFKRERDLWNKKITAEQDYLNAKNASQEASIRLDLSRQKLHALGIDGEVNEKGNARFHEVKSPIAGRVIARELTLGEYVDTTHSAYTVADLSVVWVETAIAPADLPFVQEGQSVTVMGGSGKALGKLIFVSPAVDPETRSAKAIVELDNQSGSWRPGEFANAAIATSTQDSDIVIPKEAMQTIEGKPVVFVRNKSGFEKRVITVGREDSRNVEITSGLSMGEPIAIIETFTLKAELGKSEAGHEH
jgi:cobalt-zinc-cadmium efflux system membrane fusion protein